MAAAVLALPAWRHWNETPPPPPPALRLELPSLPDLAIGSGPDYPFGLAFAPDGRRIAFAASRDGAAQLWVRDATTGEAAALAGTDDALLPFWSPQGDQIGFFADGRLKAITLANGAIADLAAAPAPRGGVWHPDGSIIFAPNDDGLVEWRPHAGDLRSVTRVDAASGETAHRFPALARRPGRDPRFEVMYFVEATEAARAGLWTTSGVRLTQSETSGLVVENWVIYARGGALFAQRIEWLEDNTSQPVVTGEAQLIGMPVGRSALGHLFASATADAIVFASPRPQLRDLRWIDRGDGTQGTLATQVDAWDLRVAPHGGRVAATARDPQLNTLDIWVYEGGKLLPRRISQAIDVDESVVWAADASRVAWVQGRRSIAMRGAQAQLPEQTLRQFDTPLRLWDWSPDGHTFVVGRRRPGTRDDLLLVDARGATGPPDGSPYAQTSFNETQADISPDGRWLAYASDESGQPEIYVDSFPVPGNRARVSTGGGAEPRWGVSGNEVFFRRGRELHVASLSFAEAVPQATGTARLFDTGGDIRAYDVTPDGQRFLVNVPAPADVPAPTAMVINWRSLLR